MCEQILKNAYSFRRHVRSFHKNLPMSGAINEQYEWVEDTSDNRRSRTSSTEVVSNDKKACDQNASAENSIESFAERTSSETSETQVELRTQIKRRRSNFSEGVPEQICSKKIC